MKYIDFLEDKSRLVSHNGFDPVYMPNFLFDFQKMLVEWSLEIGRAAIFSDCGTGKTPMQLVWAENVVRKTNKNVLIITPLAVSYQTLREGEKFQIECKRSVDGKPKGKITITNYERVHLFNSDDYYGIVLDESSAIKHFTGARQKMVTEFMRKIPYRLLCTATAAPNDYIELGTASEALGQLGRMDMLGMFFKNDENSLHPIWWGARWRFKAHAEKPFWRWVCSWARALRKPSDYGFEDDGFILPKLIVKETVIESSRPRRGELLVLPAITLEEQREERKATTEERCEAVAEKVNHKDSSIVWCHYNAEGDLLEKLIPDARQVAGKDSDDKKEELFRAFSDRELRVLITKPKIGGFGMNWQHCSHMTMFPSHSFEQYYQSVRRCWRFGQENPVTVDIITSTGEIGVMKNMKRKSDLADKMFEMILNEMKNFIEMQNVTEYKEKMEAPLWQ